MFGDNGRGVYVLAAMEVMVLSGDGWGLICGYSFKWRAYVSKLWSGEVSCYILIHTNVNSNE